jgi:hypothetical protein
MLINSEAMLPDNDYSGKHSSAAVLFSIASPYVVFLPHPSLHRQTVFCSRNKYLLTRVFDSKANQYATAAEVRVHVNRASIIRRSEYFAQTRPCCCCYGRRMRPQILKTWDQSVATVLFKHYISPLKKFTLLAGREPRSELSRGDDATD